MRHVRRAQDNRVARARFEDHLLIEFTDASAFVAPARKTPNNRDRESCRRSQSLLVRALRAS